MKLLYYTVYPRLGIIVGTYCKQPAIKELLGCGALNADSQISVYLSWISRSNCYSIKHYGLEDYACRMVALVMRAKYVVGVIASD